MEHTISWYIGMITIVIFTFFFLLGTSKFKFINDEYHIGFVYEFRLFFEEPERKYSLQVEYLLNK